MSLMQSDNVNGEPTMKNEKQTEYLTRDRIMKMLTDDEVAKVSTVESAARLAAGDEYLDLEHLEQGVRRAVGTSAHLGNLLPRKAVHKDTWSKILAQLAPKAAATPPSRA
jgi:hypothetical protein